MTEADRQQILTDWGNMITKACVIIDGIITDVDENSFTCTVKIKDKDFNGKEIASYHANVPLKVLIGSQASLIEIPEINTNCLLTFKDKNIERPQLLFIHECSKIIIKVGGQTVEYSTDGIVFNKSKTGAVKADELKLQSNKDKDIIDTFLQVLQTPINEPGNGAPSAFQATLLAALGEKESGKWDNLENDKIKL